MHPDPELVENLTIEDLPTLLTHNQDMFNEEEEEDPKDKGKQQASNSVFEADNDQTIIRNTPIGK